jgi:hypothetical protein
MIYVSYVNKLWHKILALRVQDLCGGLVAFLQNAPLTVSLQSTGIEGRRNELLAKSNWRRKIRTTTGRARNRIGGRISGGGREEKGEERE